MVKTGSERDSAASRAVERAGQGWGAVSPSQGLTAHSADASAGAQRDKMRLEDGEADHFSFWCATLSEE